MISPTTAFSWSLLRKIPANYILFGDRYLSQIVVLGDALFRKYIVIHNKKGKEIGISGYSFISLLI